MLFSSIFTILVQPVFSAPDSFTLSTPRPGPETFQYECADEKGQKRLRSSTRTTTSETVSRAVYDNVKQKFHQNTVQQTLTKTSISVNNKHDSSNQKYLWQMFSMSYISKETNQQIKNGRIPSGIDPSLRTFTVGQNFSYTFVDEVRSKDQKIAPSTWRWSTDLKVSPRENMSWNGKTYSVFVLRETRKVIAERGQTRLGETFVSYYSPDRKAILRAVYTTERGLKNDCTLVSSPDKL